ncbi:hypothetical protein BCR33DRAFT_779409 [Rhizoclosmatium globosum]|uniref:Pyrroloquinoline quinone-dependent pyranose dehydrogenase beta-propeller domain-containing protein n=1 Tax=Rhizoclosmatium globosum TaxID=329046 RepID=A0A1Y2D1C2_9FUNG|nr:hypothetical protein BCR33DRAFT_779409 [Rhizoclosmatium globosum]|eukprot:ORY53050.1 hypothetical protein BCR33DRAFT_779409 [Rhizoclosmatium globosum]
MASALPSALQLPTSSEADVFSPLLPPRNTAAAASRRRSAPSSSPRRAVPPPPGPARTPRSYAHRLPIIGCFLFAWLMLAYHAVADMPPLEERVTAKQPGISVALLANGFPGARTVLDDGPNAFLVVTTTTRTVIRVTTEAGLVVGKRTILDWTGAFPSPLTHGLELVPLKNSTYLLASSADAVYGWEYNRGEFVDMEATFTVIKNINGAAGGKKGHISRSLNFEASTGYLYVSIGSLNNVDADSKQARIVRFKIVDENGELILPDSEEGYDFIEDGEVWADGLRNSVAQAWDSAGRLWEANNGPAMLGRSDLRDAVATHLSIDNSNLDSSMAKSNSIISHAIDFHNDSPVEEINLLDEKGAFYGYPFCFTAGNISLSFDNDPIRGTQWAWMKGGVDGVHDDDWCRNSKNNKPPAAHLPAHTTPISMVFLKDGDGCGKIKNVSFPCNVVGNLIITLHGSWNRDIPIGYSVVMVPFENGYPKRDGKQLNSVVTLFEATDLQKKCVGNKANSCFRPTGIAVWKERGTLIVASDSTGELVEVAFAKEFHL